MSIHDQPSKAIASGVESVLIVQPNGNILCEYYEQTLNRRLQRKNSELSLKMSTNNKSDQTVQAINKTKEAVIEHSRKLLLSSYLNQTHKIMVDGRLVFYRAKHNVLVLVVSNLLGIDPFDISGLISETLSFFNQKCNSMMIEAKLPNKKPNQYQSREFAKIQYQISDYILQRVAKEKARSTVSKVTKLRKIERDFQRADMELKQRQQYLQQIKERNFKLKKQLSFKDRTLNLAAQLKVRQIFSYLCAIFVIGVSFLLYTGLLS